MNKTNFVIGSTLFLIGLWFFAALSTLEIEKGSDPKRVIIREGVVRTEEELANALAEDTGFDLEGAYREGYTPRDVVDFLIRAPHKYKITVYKNRFYEGRITIRYIIPFSISLFFIVLGAGIAARAVINNADVKFPD